MSTEQETAHITSPTLHLRSKSQQASLSRIVKAQVTLLVSNLDNDNFTRKATEINNLIETHGEEIRQHLIRYLLSDLGTASHFRLLKEHVSNHKPHVLVSFGLALEHYAKSTEKLDLNTLFDKLEFDAFEKILFSIPLFSGVKKEISKQAQVVYEDNIQLATSSNLPDQVIQYLFNAITIALQNDCYDFDLKQLEQFIQKQKEQLKNKALAQQLDLALDTKLNHGKGLKQRMIDMYNTNPSSVTHILDMIKELEVLPSILDSLPPFLALDLASLASHQKLIHLESWLQQKMKENETFITQVLDYLCQKVALESSRQQGDYLPIALSLETMNTFLKVLSSTKLSKTHADMLTRVQNQCLQTFPKLMNVRTQALPGSTGAEVSFPADVEEEANLYYERIYNGELSIDDMIDLLKRKSNSKDTREQDVFACMIHNLFDEYLFFPKYPDKELSMTSILFGSLIQHGLVTHAPLSIALGYVLDSIRHPLGSKMFNFGVQALSQFKSRLHEWPQYCQHLLQIPDFVKSRPDLIQFCKDQSNPFTCVHVPKIKTDILYHDPNDNIQDQILFIINNVAHNNLDTKVAELSKILDPPLFQWFSHYLIVKRVSLEPNNHDLYVLVLDTFCSKLLNAHVLAETFSNILILLNSEKTISNSTERSLLKNLGSWLGRLTLAKNKPILHKSIAFKDLLLQAYDTQRLIVTIPFTCKVLEQCAHSKVFKPPNPWLMAILKLLVELYHSADLKLNLKFEIEVLCKSLSIELKDIDPTTVLKNREPQQQLQQQPTPSHAFVAPGYPVPLQMTEQTEIPVPNLAPYIAFNPQISLFTAQPAAKRLVLQAFTESIREIIGPVVERAVAIAVVSTRDLVSKDFVMEMDENKMRKAAHMMAQNLAASLAMVTSKEPLRLSIVANLRTIFLAHGLNDSSAEQAIILTVADNLDLMCAVIEKAAMEKVTVEIDQALLLAFANRKKHREQRPNQPFIDMETYQMSGFPSTLPPRLCPKPTGILPSQFSVYEDFMRVPRSTPVPYDKPSAHMILERFTQCMTELEKLANQTHTNSFHALPQHADIRNLIRQIPMLALSSFDKCEAARTFAQKVVQLLYKSERQLLIEIYVVLLENLCEVSPNVGTLVTSWLTHADDERKYNVPVTVALIKAGLIDLPEQDHELSILIDSGRSSAIEFTVKLIRACLFNENPPLATRQEFKASLESLSKLRHQTLVSSLLEEIRKTQPEDAGLREQLAFFFGEWVRLYQHPATTEKTMLTFATQLSQQSIFKVEEMTSLFYRVCIEASVDHAIKFKMTSGPSTAYQPMDALSKLLVTLLQVPEAEQMTLFTRALSVIVLVISHHHQVRGQHFDQRPFLRLFSNLLTDLHVNEPKVQYFALLTALSNTFFTLQPTHFSGFTFAWLQLISHRLFMPQLLLAENQIGWPTFQRLLVCLFQFLVPYLRNVELGDTTRMLYRGTLRVLLVLLHDFPEFLCDYHYSFCDVIPSTCIQLRNLILSAFPRSMRLPDPFTPNLKIDLLPEIHQSPRILSDFTAVIEASSLLKDLNVYLETQKSPTEDFLLELKHDLKSKEEGYHVTLLNAVVFYLGTVTIAKGEAIHQGPAMEIYQYLLSEFDSEGRYLFLSAIANQLRYPNSHTHYFSCVLLYLFAESSKEIVKEQITRVLLERLIVNRPHPWGLLITFIELIKNPRYSFWSHSFTRCATDIERLFESVSRSINQN